MPTTFSEDTYKKISFITTTILTFIMIWIGISQFNIMKSQEEIAASQQVVSTLQLQDRYIGDRINSDRTTKELGVYFGKLKTKQGIYELENEFLKTFKGLSDKNPTIDESINNITNSFDEVAIELYDASFPDDFIINKFHSTIVDLYKLLTLSFNSDTVKLLQDAGHGVNENYLELARNTNGNDVFSGFEKLYERTLEYRKKIGITD